MKRDLFNLHRVEQQAKQDAMAKNISKLKSKDAKKAQVHVLCRSLVAMMKARVK
ncbi:hypothetical protein ACPCHQ_11725 [Ralstonia thomasii]|jgi:hypothetical protein|uniref:Uncharacterized protein n=2 Tax=Ralstonia TaxID=48736 RepID=A0ABM9JF38_9RALS|nr:MULTISPECIES: hypothetical protein [Ralstonia]MBT2177763.1 hypothetical protein [Ralstonia pickettii]CAJ0710643.1 hypothetical protein LMG7143_01663 [Ralstonia sp. LMG 18095]CAJ0792053.1 hypothetical protein LMG18095_02259 [Ralstonia sp. LMG 18095]